MSNFIFPCVDKLVNKPVLFISLGTEINCLNYVLIG